jgi:hypothetical protein
MKAEEIKEEESGDELFWWRGGFVLIYKAQTYMMNNIYDYEQ